MSRPMKVLVQRVVTASVAVEGVQIARIGHGLVALVGVGHDDGVAEAQRLAAKTAALRVFVDPEGGPERSVRDVAGSVLVVSQFTLMGDTRTGNRPSWSAAAGPGVAAPCVEAFAESLRGHGVDVACGRFGAQMELTLVGDGPLTVMLTT